MFFKNFLKSTIRFKSNNCRLFNFSLFYNMFSKKIAIFQNQTDIDYKSSVLKP